MGAKGFYALVAALFIMTTPVSAEIHITHDQFTGETRQSVMGLVDGFITEASLVKIGDGDKVKYLMRIGSSFGALKDAPVVFKVDNEFFTFKPVKKIDGQMVGVEIHQLHFEPTPEFIAKMREAKSVMMRGDFTSNLQFTESVPPKMLAEWKQLINK